MTSRSRGKKGQGQEQEDVDALIRYHASKSKPKKKGKKKPQLQNTPRMRSSYDTPPNMRTSLDDPRLRTSRISSMRSDSTIGSGLSSDDDDYDYEGRGRGRARGGRRGKVGGIEDRVPAWQRLALGLGNVDDVKTTGDFDEFFRVIKQRPKSQRLQDMRQQAKEYFDRATPSDFYRNALEMGGGKVLPAHEALVKAKIAEYKTESETVHRAVTDAIKNFDKTLESPGLTQAQRARLQKAQTELEAFRKRLEQEGIGARTQPRSRFQAIKDRLQRAPTWQQGLGALGAGLAVFGAGALVKKYYWDAGKVRRDIDKIERSWKQAPSEQDLAYLNRSDVVDSLKWAQKYKTCRDDKKPQECMTKWVDELKNLQLTQLDLRDFLENRESYFELLVPEPEAQKAFRSLLEPLKKDLAQYSPEVLALQKDLATPPYLDILPGTMRLLAVKEGDPEKTTYWLAASRPRELNDLLFNPSETFPPSHYATNAVANWLLNAPLLWTDEYSRRPAWRLREGPEYSPALEPLLQRITGIDPQKKSSLLNLTTPSERRQLVQRGEQERVRQGRAQRRESKEESGEVEALGLGLGLGPDEEGGYEEELKRIEQRRRPQEQIEREQREARENLERLQQERQARREAREEIGLGEQAAPIIAPAAGAAVPLAALVAQAEGEEAARLAALQKANAEADAKRLERERERAFEQEKARQDRERKEREERKLRAQSPPPPPKQELAGRRGEPSIKRPEWLPDWDPYKYHSSNLKILRTKAGEIFFYDSDRGVASWFPIEAIVQVGTRRFRYGLVEYEQVPEPGFSEIPPRDTIWDPEFVDASWTIAFATRDKTFRLKAEDQVLPEKTRLVRLRSLINKQRGIEEPPQGPPAWLAKSVDAKYEIQRLGGREIFTYGQESYDVNPSLPPPPRTRVDWDMAVSETHPLWFFYKGSGEKRVYSWFPPTLSYSTKRAVIDQHRMVKWSDRTTLKLGNSPPPFTIWEDPVSENWSIATAVRARAPFKYSQYLPEQRGPIPRNRVRRAIQSPEQAVGGKQEVSAEISGPEVVPEEAFGVENPQGISQSEEASGSSEAPLAPLAPGPLFAPLSGPIRISLPSRRPPPPGPLITPVARAPLGRGPAPPPPPGPPPPIIEETTSLAEPLVF